MTTAERYRSYRGAPVFAMGFRPFFLFGAAFAACALPLWIIGFHGWIPGVNRDWHVHEMLFGYLAAVIAGFLLTAVPNWTGRLPVAGAPLAALFSLWCAGRLVMLLGAGTLLAAVIDTAFLFALAGIIAREVIAAGNKRNLAVCALVLILAGANVLTHLRSLDPALGLLGERLALGVIAMLVALIGGRITPSFTRNWMAKQKLAPEPASPGLFDIVALIATAAALGAWVIAPNSPAAGAALVVAGVLTLARLSRWKGWRTAAEPLVIILHTGYLWLGVAFLLLGGSALAPQWIAGVAGIHALTAGAFGVMTLAVMTRASRGHTGQSLSAGAGTQAIYVLVNLGALLRVASPFFADAYLVLIIASAIAWSAAFAGFVIAYAPLLLHARRGA
ncbi:MAG: NnrS family protein [Hyphomonadaceae bacterium]|nr:NnrS family protein [Hyphomonadaceae bacterium]